MGAGASTQPKPSAAATDPLLDVQELTALLAGIGITNWSRKRVEHFLGVLDVNGDGKVDKAKMVAVLSQLFEAGAKLATLSVTTLLTDVPGGQSGASAAAAAAPKPQPAATGASATAAAPFAAAKYQKGWRTVEGWPEVPQLRRYGLALREGVDELLALFRAFLLDPKKKPI